MILECYGCRFLRVGVLRGRESLWLVEAIEDDNKSHDLVTLLSLLSALSCSELLYIQRPEFL